MRAVYYIKHTHLNLGRDERCTPRVELKESARLAPVLGATISSWRVEVVKPMKSYAVVLDSWICGKGTNYDAESFHLEQLDV